jgi:hypothetical protein
LIYPAFLAIANAFSLDRTWNSWNRWDILWFAFRNFSAQLTAQEF